MMKILLFFRGLFIVLWGLFPAKSRLFGVPEYSNEMDVFAQFIKIMEGWCQTSHFDQRQAIPSSDIPPTIEVTALSLFHGNESTGRSVQLRKGGSTSSSSSYSEEGEDLVAEFRLGPEGPIYVVVFSIVTGDRCLQSVIEIWPTGRETWSDSAKQACVQQSTELIRLIGIIIARFNDN